MDFNRSVIGASIALTVLVTACGSSKPPASPPSLETTCALAFAEIRMPFEVQLPAESGVNQIRVRTELGNYRNLTFGPWGAHASPHTGHTDGNAKADMLLPYTTGYAALTYLPDPQLPCTAGNFAIGDEVQCGIAADAILADRFGFIAPGDGYEIIAIYKEFELDAATSFYAFSGPQWKVVMRKTVGDCNLGLSFGHVAWLGETVTQALELRGIDWQNAPIGENLSDHDDPIAVSAGDVVAYPQIAGHPSELADGYIVPDVASTSVWTQVEFFVNVDFRNADHESESYHIPVYRGLSEADYATWSQIFVSNVLDPLNDRYGTEGSQSRRWLWAAEGELILNPGFEASDASTLTSALGSWWEGHPDCASDSTLCDQMVTFFPIYRDTTLFADVSSTYDPDTRYVMGNVWGVDQSRVFGEVVAIFDYPAGAYVSVATLDDTLRGAIVLRVRTELAPADLPLEDHILGYQVLRYDLDPVAGRLVLGWGALRDSEALALADVGAPPPTQQDPCTGVSNVEGSTTCHHKIWQGDYISVYNVFP